LVHRHTTLSERGEEGGLGDPPLFDQFAGWKMGSPMRRRHIHLKSKSSSRAILKQWGVKLETDEGEQQQAAKNRKNILKPLSCTSCNEVNETGAKFCRKFGMVLSFNYYKATTKEAGETKKMLEETARQLVELRAKQKKQLRGSS